MNRRAICWVSFLVLAGLVDTICAAGKVNYNRDVRPLLSDRCYQCHGPDEQERKASLRLDRFEGEESAASVIVSGDIEASELWKRIVTEDESEVMPPPEAHKKPFTEAEKRLLQQWIEEGAKVSDFWAFVPPTLPQVPSEAIDSGTDAIDHFVRARLRDEGLEPLPSADKRTLVRRLCLDLTGLPPTIEEIQEFLADDSDNAYENLVDRLLAKPQYGEHMTKYWLDLVRFADTNGIHHDHYREMTPYRDWVIRAFNDNLPYNEFVTFQVAGDLYDNPTQDQLIASGFNRLHLIIDVGTALPEESYTKNVIDRVTAVGTAFMGLTVQCAVCHDHKYDPITQKDFFSLFAFFNNLDADPETGGRRGIDFEKGLQAPYISLANESQRLDLSNLEIKVEEAKSALSQAESMLAAITQDEDRKSLEQEVVKAKALLKQAEDRKTNLLRSIAFAMVMKEREEIRPAYILTRGDYDKPGKEVQRNTPEFLPPLPKTERTPNRMDFAQWLTDRQNPLTARVAVNRFWQQLFGVGIVKTSEDFGSQGEWPSHPELLDFLTVRFVDSGWDVKGLMKELVMSETYKQASSAAPEAFATDPENRLLARGSRYRLDSEVLRDQILFTSGLLNGELFGKSVKPPQPEGLWKAVILPSSYPNSFQADSGDKIYRRSLYTFWKRAMPPPQMTIFNAPTREACIARRERTNTPSQALVLLNEPQYFNAAKALAEKLLNSSGDDDTSRLRMAYERITSQVPDDGVMGEFLVLLGDLREAYRMAPELAEALQGDGGGEMPAPELAAWTVVINTIYNLDITKTRY